MESANRSMVKAFIILGFPAPLQLRMFFFTLVLLTYVLTVTANVIIILVIKANRKLQRPMYYFLGNFSFMEIWYTTSTVPKMLETFLMGGSTISVEGCIVQLYLFFALGSTECFLLATMAYDRYLAICRPLHYPALMTLQVTTWLVIAAWMGGFLAPLVPIILISQLSFCEPKEIHHFFCDAGPLLRRSCGRAALSSTLVSVLASLVILSSCLLTMVSYIFIISTILRIPSASGRQKAFSTCGSHLAVVVIYYATVIFIYVRPIPASSSNLDTVASVFYAVVTPLLNPMIYSLRNKEVKDALKKLMSSNRVFMKSISTLIMGCH
ncbi:olfactory receptor 6F1-like [Hemicordylus capensis]|uniref:olfactory receptor 6F1-like n=1 Tax=Hemicordylus capensis TaxID=884348 RepID=UPI0023024AD8|nr:olfactory receptor 6F1-like [Hemicordylus capensis]XP_053122393.1 olfactory receptor 6F1-like [Hemicordylus capensis]